MTFEHIACFALRGSSLQRYPDTLPSCSHFFPFVWRLCEGVVLEQVLFRYCLTGEPQRAPTLLLENYCIAHCWMSLYENIHLLRNNGSDCFMFLLCGKQGLDLTFKKFYDRCTVLVTDTAWNSYTLGGRERSPCSIEGLGSSQRACLKLHTPFIDEAMKRLR